MKKLLVLAVLAAAVWYAARLTAQPAASETLHQAVSQSSVLAQIRTLNRLESTAFYIDTIIRTEKQGNWYALWQDSQKGIFVAKGSVTAGLDLDKLTADSVQVLPGRVIINLPPAQVLAVRLEHLEIYDLRTGAFNLVPADTAVLDTVQKQAKAEILRQACHNRIVRQANERAREQIERLFALSGQSVSVYASAVEDCQAA